LSIFIKDFLVFYINNKAMFYHNFQIVHQEVPGEISLSFTISGCSLQCEGCHSPFLWKEGNGTLLTMKNFENILNKYKGYASCVLFMGGEWHSKELIAFLKIANLKKYKTCLYTGQDTVSKEIGKELTWIKTGRWIQNLGGLDCQTTNQKFTHVKTQKILNYLFSKN